MLNERVKGYDTGTVLDMPTVPDQLSVWREERTTFKSVMAFFIDGACHWAFPKYGPHPRRTAKYGHTFIGTAPAVLLRVDCGFYNHWSFRSSIDLWDSTWQSTVDQSDVLTRRKKSKDTLLSWCQDSSYSCDVLMFLHSRPCSVHSYFLEHSFAELAPLKLRK